MGGRYPIMAGLCGLTIDSLEIPSRSMVLRGVPQLHLQVERIRSIVRREQTMLNAGSYLFPPKVSSDNGLYAQSSDVLSLILQPPQQHVRS